MVAKKQGRVHQWDTPLLPRTIIQSYAKFKNSWLFGAKMPLLFYIENQIARQPRNIPFQVRLQTVARITTALDASATKSVCTCHKYIYTEQTWGKMRHLKPVCLTEIDFISSSVNVITEMIFIAIFNIRSPLFGQTPPLL